MKKSKITLSGILFICITLAVSCSSQREAGYTTWDADRNNRVDRQEFETAFRDRDTYGDWDKNDDRRLDRDEWETGFNVYSSSYPYDEEGAFDEWDTERDDYIDENEFLGGTFDFLDDNDDDYIEESEYNNWNDDN